MTSSGPRSFGKYLLEREIARGGMARVHLATLRGLGGFEKKLVVKEILPELASDPKFVAMFVEEAKVLVALSHPNIVPVYELGIVDGTYFLAMEHVEGATLADLVAARPLGPAEAARVGTEIADALAYAHERFDVVHRDVSPRNVMVDTAGHARLLDFGIAARAEVGEGDALYGTPGFLSPEQARGERLGPASDLFALGCVLAFATRGASPFGAKEIERVRALAEPPAITIAGAPELERVVRELLAPSPGARPASARAVARTLAAIASALEEDESAVTTLADRARAPHAAPGPRDEEPAPASTAPVTPGRVETLAQSQALDAILGTAPIAPATTTPIATAPQPPADEPDEAPRTAKIERAKPAAEPAPAPTTPEATVPTPPRRGPAIALSVVAALIAGWLVRSARYELVPTPPVDADDHGLTAPEDFAPLPIEDAGESDAAEPGDAGVAPDAGPLDAASAGDAGLAARGRDAGARAQASLTVRVTPWAEVTLDGRAVGRAGPVLRLRVSAGTHTVHVENPATGHEETRTIEASAGETVELRINLPE